MVLFRIFPIFLGFFLLYKAMTFSGDFLEKTLDAVKGIVTTYETRSIMTLLASEYIDKGRLPSDIKKWMNKHFQAPAGRDKTLDPYGNPYIIKSMEKGGFEIRSRGPDGKLYTRDDIVVKYGY